MDLFTQMPEEKAIAERRAEAVSSVTAMPNSDINLPLEFRIAPVGDSFLDLSPTILEVHLKIQFDVEKDEDKGISDKSEVVLINNTLMSMFSGIEISVNNTVVVPNNSVLAWTAYADVVTGYSLDVRRSWLAASGYEDEEPSGYLTEKGKARFKPFYKNGVKSFIGPIQSSFFKMSKYIVPGVEIIVRLFRQKPEFLLLHKYAEEVDKSKNFKVTIEKALLHIRCIRLHDNIKKSIDRMWDKTPAIYEYGDIVAKTILVPTNVFNVDAFIHDGLLPSRIDIIQIRQSAATGSTIYNPLFMDHYHVKTLSFEKNGQAVKAPYQCDFSNRNYAQMYLDYFQSRGCSLRQSGSSAITYNGYGQGSTIISFNLDRFDECDSTIKSAGERGTLRLKIDYDSAKSRTIDDTIVVLCLMHFNHAFAIDSQRNVGLKVD